MRKLILLVAFLCLPYLAFALGEGGIHGVTGTFGTPDGDSVNSSKILDNTILSADINDNTILTGKIADGTIVAADIADNVVTSAKLLDNTILTGKIADGTIAKVDMAAAAYAMTILDNVAGPTAAQSYNSLNLVNAEITVLLPTGVAGMNTCVRATGADYTVIIDIQGTDTIALLGAADTAGQGIESSGGTATGDFACVVATAANTWVVMARQGTWAQQ